MKSLTYLGPGHVLRLPSGRQVRAGETAEVTDQDAASVEALDSVTVIVAADGTDIQDNEEE